MSKNSNPQHQQTLSIPEYARHLGISRIAVYKQVRKGLLPARKVGRNYVILVDNSSAGEVIPQVSHKPVHSEYIPVIQLAKELGISRIAVYKRIRKGQIDGQKAGRNFVISTQKEQQRGLEMSHPVQGDVSIPELAAHLGISRVAVFQRVKKGCIKAEKCGRNYVVSKEEFQRVKNIGRQKNKPRQKRPIQGDEGDGE